MAPLYLALLLASSICVSKALESPERYRRSKRETKTEKGSAFQYNQTKEEDRPLMKIGTFVKGIPGTKDYRMFFKNEHGPISPYHDIPLFVNAQDKIFNMVVEVPRWTNEKMEICLDEPLNPIKHRIENNTLKYIPDVFPHEGYVFNYGSVPETWENPDLIDPHTGLKGDGDPIDIMEIGARIAARGEIMHVKVLGAMGVIEDGQIDWKIIAICVNDPDAPRLNDIGDVDIVYPGYLKGLVKWFKEYKFDNGKPESKLAFNEAYQNRTVALRVIEDAWKQWINMMLKKKEEPPHQIALMNTCIRGHPNHVPFFQADLEIWNGTPTASPMLARKGAKIESHQVTTTIKTK